MRRIYRHLIIGVLLLGCSKANVLNPTGGNDNSSESTVTTNDSVKVDEPVMVGGSFLCLLDPSQTNAQEDVVGCRLETKGKKDTLSRDTIYELSAKSPTGEDITITYEFAEEVWHWYLHLPSGKALDSEVTLRTFTSDRFPLDTQAVRVKERTPVTMGGQIAFHLGNTPEMSSCAELHAKSTDFGRFLLIPIKGGLSFNINVTILNVCGVLSTGTSEVTILKENELGGFLSNLSGGQKFFIGGDVNQAIIQKLSLAAGSYYIAIAANSPVQFDLDDFYIERILVEPTIPLEFGTIEYRK